ncbi:transglycosylase domain-containing protein [Sphingomicrobium lutaoense]|uniref:Penicillin-binding protein 1A n=1 Tax=Sphingomicrobium lutaoense TaxID=515949 RepID=A0A839Z2F2_9SPHN|nr:PBP1A family penicillin-binding protein [Sphingomicrobium lutaoense]MBB3764810.1 penicillin-binding protein 1A [Sphingomicrobium lutaoense]
MAEQNRTRRVAVQIFKWTGILSVAALAALFIAVLVAHQSLPSYEQLKRRDDLGQTIRIRADDGSVLVSMGPSFGRWLEYDEIPQTMKTAMIAVEDRRFRHHPGVDPIGIGRGILDSITKGHRVRGVSTISQQLARNVFLTPEREIGRKIREGIIALALEQKFSKDQILELYLNRVYFGGGAYGIDAASRTFYGHSAERLSLGEAAIIAGLVKAPSNYSPTADIEAARDRANVVLDLMVEHGFLSPAAAASVNPAEIRLERRTNENSARYFTDWALPQLDTLIDETSAPIDVWTTLDPEMQDAADKAINAHAPSGVQGALVAIDRDGAVRAMVGGKDYVESIYNRAAVARRQPGSAFKLFVYLTALENGYKPGDVVVDEQVTIDGWTPRNSNRRFLGPITLREAFARSVNTVSAKIGAELGFSTIARMATRFGITDDISIYPSMVLGTSEVRLLDMTRAFAAVARGGTSLPPYAIKRVVTADGRLLYEHRPAQERVLVSPWVATDMTDLLQTAVRSGTGRAANIGRPVAGKTGTTNSNKDGWFIGFSSGLTAGVWFGRDDAKAVPGLGGGTAPARAFADFMRAAVADRPVEQFETNAPLPEWQVEPDDEAWLLDGPLYDEFGNPIGPIEPLQPGVVDPLAPRDQGGENDEGFSWIDEALRRGQRREPPQQPPQGVEIPVITERPVQPQQAPGQGRVVTPPPSPPDPLQPRP